MHDKVASDTGNQRGGFQADIRCVDSHDIERSRFHTGKRLYGRVQTVACRRCGVLLGSRLTREPKERESL